MFLYIVIALLLLTILSLALYKIFNVEKNIAVLFFCQPLVMAASPVIVFIGGILAQEMVDDASLATLPIGLMIIGVACASIPAAMLAKYKGRKFAAISGFSIAFSAAIIAMFSTLQLSFSLFMLASFLFGVSASFVQQLRFAAIESVSEDKVPRVLSLLMLSGLFAAFLGPEVTVAAQHLVDSPQGFAGSFLMLALLILCALIVVQFFKEPEMVISQQHGDERPLLTILKQPIFIIAVATGAIGYALMSYLMTATPLSMHHIHGHSLQETKWVIQSHIIAMFLPSLFTSFLIKRLGITTLMLMGTVIYCFVVIIAYSGHQVLHYWWALLLLGIGWNFLFLTGTSLLPKSYHAAERHKVQASNDFILFALQAAASLMAGWILFKTSWQVLVLTSLPFIIVLFIAYVFLRRSESSSTE